MPRRVRGEGSIRKRPSGLWEARCYGPSGRRLSYYGHTQREARSKLQDALHQMRLGAFAEPDRQTLAEFLASWLHTIQPTIKHSTHHSYSAMVAKHLADSRLARTPLLKVTPQAIQYHLRERQNVGYSARTVQYLRSILRQALGLAVRWGMVARNAAALADSPRVPKHEIEPLTPEQARRMLDTARSDRLYALYAVAVGLGMRQGEILALRWPDVDLGAATLSVRGTLTWRSGGGWEISEPKTERSRRVTSLPAPCVAALREHKVKQLEERLIAGQRWQDNGLVFTTKIGTPLNQSRLLKEFRALLESAGLPRIRFHDLRHTCASLLLAQGVGPRQIMELLGHSQIGLTMDTYTHIMPDLKREAAEAMSEVLWGTE